MDYNNVEAMYLLGKFYSSFDNKIATKYLLMAVDGYNSNAMFELGKYYEFINRNKTLMKKYYTMAGYGRNYRQG